MRMRAQFRHVDKHDIVDMYIYIHDACALNRKNVAEQKMGWNRNLNYIYVHILVSKDSIY